MPTQTMRFTVGSLFLVLMTVSSQAAILTTGVFTGTVERFDEVTGARSTLVTIPPLGPEAIQPQLSSVAYNASNGRAYVAAIQHGGLYHFNAQTGADLQYVPMGIGPGGVAISPNGDVYVTNVQANNFRIYDPTLTSFSTVTIDDLAGTTTGIGVSPNGDVIVSTFGTGVYRYDPATGNVDEFSDSSIPGGQVAFDSSNNVYIGHGLGFADDVTKFNAAGTEIGNPFIKIDSTIAGNLSGSSPFFNPSGVAIDGDGNIIVAVLGKGNPGDINGETGGLFRFDSNGDLLGSPIAMNTSAFSSVAIVPAAIPEPSSVALLVTAAGITFLSRRRRRS